MGEAKRKAPKRSRFLAENQICYFCATRPAITIEHMPSRVIFPKGFTPENYEFPACQSCNNDRSSLEQAMALYINMLEFDEDNHDEEQLMRHLLAVQNNNPDLLPNIHVPARDKRNAVKQLGIILEQGQSYHDLPIAKIPPKGRDTIQYFSRKLTCALYYKVAGYPVPRSYSIASYFIPPINGIPEERLLNLISLFEFFEVGARRNVEIGNRFEWMWNITPGRDLFAYIAKFGNSLVIVGSAIDEKPINSRNMWIPHSNDHPDLQY